MSMIARAAGGSKATLYVYFKTKADLFVALMEQTWDQLAKKPSPDHDPELATDAHSWLISWVADYLANMCDDTIITLHRLIISEAARFPSLGARVYAAGPQRGISMLSQDLAILHRRGLISCDNTEIGAHRLRALAKSHLYERRLWGAIDQVSPQQIRDHAVCAASAFLQILSQDSEIRPGSERAVKSLRLNGP